MRICLETEKSKRQILFKILMNKMFLSFLNVERLDQLLAKDLIVTFYTKQKNNNHNSFQINQNIY